VLNYPTKEKGTQGYLFEKKYEFEAALTHFLPLLVVFIISAVDQSFLLARSFNNAVISAI